MSHDVLVAVAVVMIGAAAALAILVISAGRDLDALRARVAELEQRVRELEGDGEPLEVPQSWTIDDTTGQA